MKPPQADTALSRTFDALTTIRIGGRVIWVTSPASPIPAGSRISIGMVMEEPGPAPGASAPAPEELAKTRPVMAIEVDGQRFESRPYVPAVPDKYLRSVAEFVLKAPAPREFDVLLVAPDGSTLFEWPLPRVPAEPWGVRPAVFRLPQFGQTGMPVEVAGPFDGEAATTEVLVGGRRANILAETETRTWFFSPVDLAGAFEIQVSDGGQRAAGSYRALALQLSAPTTELNDGQKVDVTLSVRGLQGLDATAPIVLEKVGNVSMQDGSTQTILIEPGMVRDGAFTTTRTITGLDAGYFSVTATVIDPPRRPRLVRVDQDAGVNGYRARRDGQSLELELASVQDAATGRLASGNVPIEARCRMDAPPVMGQVVLTKGRGKVRLPCSTLVPPRLLLNE
jgi:hypothetical protein